MFNILVVEDNKDLLEITCLFLRRKGFITIPAANGAAALEEMDKQHIDLCVVDLMMPEMNGYEFIKTLKTAKYNTPIIVVTAQSDFDNMKNSFDLGVDDYLVKPINYDELYLRINAVLRRMKIAADRKIQIRTTILDYDALTLTQGTDEQLLPKKEFQLLYLLLSYPNRIFTRQQLIDEIWGYDNFSDERTINTHINRLRERLKNNNDVEIITIRGLGYKAVKKG